LLLHALRFILAGGRKPSAITNREAAFPGHFQPFQSMAAEDPFRPGKLIMPRRTPASRGNSRASTQLD
jgi:hypothetical protein